ncbi:unnamed protein product [Commensalibacter communis]|uniref:Hedgehog/Intein (Hint) domain-containing protein n=1 Tax=Commensalibacter communis TaxID=2972786 RepID=A0A9W4X6Z7_9PROT|nr:Hint domain-containing protein [Commensalibacter communis]CAI3922246.1 unnamed protein product [Commensalibacter communis]CAI3943584.1 unnamed protein product [Commensalibacter communis]CAI3950951.1 unnamed protein product [Commensalibacter communis]CAI3952576.1 unnamed protein product [Commensalibacter communis]
MVDNNQLTSLGSDTNYNNFVIKNDWPIIGPNIRAGDESYYARLDPTTGNTYFYDSSNKLVTDNNGNPITQPVNIIAKRLYVEAGATVEGNEIIALNRNPEIYVQKGGTLVGNNIYNSTVALADGAVSERNYNVSTKYNIAAGGVSMNDSFVEPGGTVRTPFDNPNNTIGLTVLAGDGGADISIASGGVMEDASFPKLNAASNPSASAVNVGLYSGSQYNLPAGYSADQFKGMNVSNDNPVLWGGSWTARLVDGKTVYINGTQTLDGPVNLLNGATLTIENGAVVEGLNSFPGSRIIVNNGGTIKDSNIYSNNITVQSGGISQDNTYVSSQISLANGATSDSDGFYNVPRQTDLSNTFTNPNLNQYLSSNSTNFNASTQAGSFSSGGINSNLLNPTFDNQSGPGFWIYPYGGENNYPCFLAGSLISTPMGDVKIEALRLGDEIYTLTPQGKKLQVITSIVCDTYYVKNISFDDIAGYPVCITKDAIAPSVPYKDLFVTAEHCVFLDDKFIPVRMLVNGRSIYYDRSKMKFIYYHIETGEHSVIIVNGMLTESFLNTQNHTVHDGNVIRMRKKTWAGDAAAPLTVDRGSVEPIFNRLLNRAIKNNIQCKDIKKNVTNDHNVQLITDNGKVIDRIMVQGQDKVIFIVPRNTCSVRIRSRSGRLSDTVGPFIDDRRPLGVLVKNITIFNRNKIDHIETHLLTKDLAGWYDSEDASLRWTNGDAFLPLDDYCKEDNCILILEIVSAGPYFIQEERGIQMAV